MGPEHDTPCAPWITLHTSEARVDAAAVRERPARHPEIVHSTIEVHVAPGAARA